jgi:hypothetical protein
MQKEYLLSERDWCGLMAHVSGCVEVESSQGEKDEINGRRESGHSLVEIIRREKW